MAIHKGFKLNELGGFPLNQQRLELMQAAYADIADSLAGLCGNNTIVAGCAVIGNNVMPGWVVIGGELLPFAGGVKQDTVIVRETTSKLTFKDGVGKPVQYSRYAVFGIGAGAVVFDTLIYVGTLAQMEQGLHNVAIEFGKHQIDTQNPHGVSKKQVGLGNIPNAITNDPTVNDEQILATSAMVNAKVSDRARVLASGQIELSPHLQIHLLPILNKAIDLTSVFLQCHIVVRTTSPNAGVDLAADAYYVNDSYNILNYVMIERDGNANTTHLRIAYHPNKMAHANSKFFFNYQLIQL